MTEKKKISTPLFIVLATLLNLVLIAVVFILMMLFLSFINSRVASLSEEVFMVLLAVAVILSFIIALFIYRKIIARIADKYDIGGKK